MDVAVITPINRVCAKSGQNALVFLIFEINHLIAHFRSTYNKNNDNMTSRA